MELPRVNRTVLRIVELLLNHPKPVNVILVFTFVLGCVLSARLELKSDFSALLPPHLPSVKAVEQVSERLGGAGNLMIGIESPNFEANKNFVEALVQKLNPLKGQYIRSLDYRFNDLHDFANKFGPQYLSTSELKKALKGQKPEPVGPIQAFAQYRDGYLSANDGQILVINIFPTGSGLGLESGDELISIVKNYIAELDPKKFSPDLQVNLAGSIHSSVEEMAIIKKDMFGTALLLISLLIAALVLFLWSMRAVTLLLAHLIMPVAWTFGLTKIFVGFLNTQTAFLGSLVVGTGINYGIILLSRYRESRQEGRPTRESILRAVESTWLATLIASSTTAVGFLSLFLTANRGLSQFGFVGFVGVICCWIGAFTILPLWLFQWEQRSPVKVTPHPWSGVLNSITEKFGNLLTARYLVGIIGILLVTFVSGYGIRKLTNDPIEYNIHNLRTESATTTGTEAVEARLNKVFGNAETPSIVMLNHLDDAKAFCSIVQAKQMSEACLTAFDILPPSIELTNERRQLFSLMRLTTTPPTLNDLPASLKARFEDKEGRLGLIAYITPDRTKPLHQGDNLLKYTEAFSNIEMPSGDKVTAAGDWFILADLLRALKKEGPIVAAVSFALICLLSFWLAGSVRFGMLISSGLAIATLWMLGAQGFFEIRYNFFNFVALPLTFGMGIDYPINVFVRCRQEGFQNYGRILATSGVAVILCSLTTIIGYYTLIDASNLALRSFAELAIIGEFACLGFATLGLPVLLRSLGYFSPETYQNIEEQRVRRQAQ